MGKAYIVQWKSKLGDDEAAAEEELASADLTPDEKRRRVDGQ